MNLIASTEEVGRATVVAVDLYSYETMQVYMIFIDILHILLYMLTFKLI